MIIKGKKLEEVTKLQKLKAKRKLVDDEIAKITEDLKSKLANGIHKAGPWEVQLVDVEREFFDAEKAKKLLSKTQMKKCLEVRPICTLYIKKA